MINLSTFTGEPADYDELAGMDDTAGMDTATTDSMDAMDSSGQLHVSAEEADRILNDDEIDPVVIETPGYPPVRARKHL
jgi:hypothetical protein